MGDETTACNRVSLEADLDQGVTQGLAASPSLQDLRDHTAAPGPGPDQGPGPGPGRGLALAPAPAPGLALAAVHLRRATPRRVTAPACQLLPHLPPLLKGNLVLGRALLIAVVNLLLEMY